MAGLTYAEIAYSLKYNKLANEKCLSGNTCATRFLFFVHTAQCTHMDVCTEMNRFYVN